MVRETDFHRVPRRKGWIQREDDEARAIVRLEVAPVQGPGNVLEVVADREGKPFERSLPVMEQIEGARYGERGGIRIERQIEIDPGLKIPVTPVLKSALRAVEGVLEVEEV